MITPRVSNARTAARGRWRKMVRRCTNPDDRAWKHYGGRGITVCARWLNSFEDYYADTGDAPEGMTLDRTNNDFGYFPGNVRWATAVEQRANRRWDPNLIKTHCPEGHAYDEQNTYRLAGKRYCRACDCNRTAAARLKARHHNESVAS